MNTFAVVSRIDHLPRMLSDLAGLWRIHRIRAAAGELMFAGIWVEHSVDAGAAADLSLPDWLATVAFPVTTPLELSGLWAVCTAEAQELTRAALLDAIIDATRQNGGHGDGRFIPVFHESQPLDRREAEWRTLAARHPGIVLPPLEQSRSGVVTFTEIGAVDPPVHRSDDRTGDVRRVP